MQYWSGITMSMYFVHDAFRTFIFPTYLGIPDSLSQKFIYLLLYLAVVTIFASFFDAAVKWLIQLGGLLIQFLQTEKKITVTSSDRRPAYEEQPKNTAV